MKTFKVGDKIQCINEFSYNPNIKAGCKATIVYKSIKQENDFSIEFEKNIQGHNGGFGEGIFTGKNGHCWNMSGTDIEKNFKLFIKQLELF